jgi:group I intron endonuclease
VTGIYKITNVVNGKVYIGQSVNIEKRFINHKSSAYNSKNKSYDYPLPRAIRKYGFENFQFEILEECSIDELNDKERWYIAQYHAHGPRGYNQDDGGDQASHYNKLSDDLVSEIIKKLKTSLDNSDDIGDEFGVSGRTIRSINSGEACRRDNEVYPIRPPLWTLDDTTSMAYKIKANEHSCKICGATTYVKNCLCVECAHKAQRRTDRPEKLQLAQMIKDYGFKGTGKKFGVSDNAIKKWCKAYGIPHLKNELIYWYNEQVST